MTGSVVGKWAGHLVVSIPQRESFDGQIEGDRERTLLHQSYPGGQLMKFLLFFIVINLSPLYVSAQGEADRSEIAALTVIEMKWRSQVRNPRLDRDILSEEAARGRDEFRRIEAERTNEKLREQGMPVNNPPVRTPRADTGPSGIAVTYLYEIKVKNTGSQEIRSFTWEYVFYEPGTDDELGRRQFESEVRIGAGRTRTVTVRSSSPPTSVVAATGNDLKPSDRYKEEVVIKSITFKDGSVWTAP
ncbi:MAG TPA: hypothetical protein PKD24_00975 [Pyrinomonadaceae bacterium]|nr:hypothetical protein [Pyrinomonadaceae bacterium]HMP64271.1 hypothetical protein [Pyrinomonadaceae bacterium]